MFTFSRMNKFTAVQLSALASTVCQMQDLEQRILNGSGQDSVEKLAGQINIRLYNAALYSGAFHKSLFQLPMVTAYRDNYGLPFNRDFPLHLNTVRYIAYKPLFGDIRIRDIQSGEEFRSVEKGVPLLERTEGVFVFKGGRVLNNTPYEDISGCFAKPVDVEDEDLVMG